VGLQASQDVCFHRWTALCKQIFERVDLQNSAVTTPELAVKRFARTVGALFCEADAPLSLSFFLRQAF
jgi:hypothetical protein